MIRTMVLVVCCLVLPAISPLAAVTPSASNASVPRVAPGAFQVTVLAAGKPLPRVRVTLGGRYATTPNDGRVVFDGVPTGEYRITAESYGFERHAASVVLPDGHRDALEISLDPVPWTEVKGSVTLKDTGQPVSGAFVTLTPVDVRSASRGVYRFTSDHDGLFMIQRIAPGLYRAEVTSPGTLPSLNEVEIAPTNAELLLLVEAETAAAAATVNVIDSATGSAISGAEVTIAEAFPSGPIVSGRTDTAGNVHFDNLDIGGANWLRADGTLGVCRRRATVHAEAAGFAERSVAVVLGAATPIVVRLDGTAAIAEREPNNDEARAQPIRLGAPVNLRISEKGDVDLFRIRIEHEALLTLTLDPPGILDREIQLLGRDLKQVARHAAYQSQECKLVVPAPPGEYFVQVTEWGGNGASDQPLVLTVAAEETADPHEPNNSPASARPVRPGEEIGGFLLPVGDVDCFRFDAPRPGVVRITVPAVPFDRTVSVLDQVGTALGTASVYPNHPLTLVVSIDQGRHYVRISEWGDNGSSTTPYRMKLDYFQGDGCEARALPGRPAAGGALELDRIVGGTVGPVGDKDIYAVILPSAGLLRLHAKSPIDLTASILSVDGSVLASGSAYARHELVLPWSSPQPRMLFVQINEWGNNNWSASPYTLAAEWEPADELEAAYSNDQIEGATPFEVGEPLRGSITPVRDHDHYVFDLDHSGHLILRGKAPTDLTLSILDADLNPLATSNSYAGHSIQVEADVRAGNTVVRVQEWSDNNSHPGTYEIETIFERAEPTETRSLSLEQPRLLRPDEARSFVIGHIGDTDRFLVDLLQAGEHVVTFWAPLDVELKLFDDRTGELVIKGASYARNLFRRSIKVSGPTRYRLELTEWGDNGRSDARAYVMIAPPDLDLVAAQIAAASDLTDPTLVRFSLSPLAKVTAPDMVEIDLEGDGRFDGVIAATGVTEFRYAAEGVYPAIFRMSGKSGVPTIVRQWVSAVGPRERKGVRLLLDFPGPSETVDRDEPIRARAISFTGSRISRVSAAIDGRLVNTSHTRPFAIEVPWQSFRSGEHRLTVTAWDVRGETALVERTFTISDYFALSPANDSVVSGRDVVVTWSGREFGPARVQYRKVGETEWQEAVGENSLHRTVRLTDLEVGVPSEFQPVGNAEPGPLRRITRIKGLAFGQSRYGATIARDYNQRLGISVRNHGEEPLRVNLGAGKPDDSRLLIGFVGEGSLDDLLDLAPGEEREFMLGLSAQDVVKRRHLFPVRIQSESGFSDEAQVEIDVKLPDVKLEWEVGPLLENGLGRRLTLINRGDPLSDLNVASDNPDLIIGPEVSHGALRAGGRIEFSAMARLHEGFTHLGAVVTASSIDRQYPVGVELAVPEGKQVFGVHLLPNSDPQNETSLFEADIMAARGMAGSYLDPREVDWEAKQFPEDSDGDGRVDRWSFGDQFDPVRWVGDDTDADGEIDFVHADVGGDGQYDYSAFREGDNFERTNLVEAWLDIKFALPWARNAYQKHDVEILMNDQVVARLQDQLPEGNYTFRLPPTALLFDDSGVPVGNKVGIKSSHLRGGHYIVTSDFGIKLRLTGTKSWVVADSAIAAQTAAAAQEGLSLTGPDYSVSSAELRLSGGELAAGNKVDLLAPVRNVGATTTPAVTVALMRSPPGGAAVELARAELTGVPLSGHALARLPWTVAAGSHQLRIIVDPDGDLADPDPSNNEAMITVDVPGDDAKPTVEIVEPPADAVLPDGRLTLVVKAGDDAGLVAVQARVDDGIWQTLAGETLFRAAGIVQPGNHSLTVRALDSSGNFVEDHVTIRSAASAPTLEWVAPVRDARIDARTTEVSFKVGETTSFAAGRVDGGPWQPATISGGTATAMLTLPFGPSRLEILAVSGTGVRSMDSATVTCTRQPEPDEEGPPPLGESPPYLAIEGIGLLDPFGAPNVLLPLAPGRILAEPVLLPESLKPGTKIEFSSVSGAASLVAMVSETGIEVRCVAGGSEYIFSGPLEACDGVVDRFFGEAACKPGLRVRYAITADGTQMLTKWSDRKVADSVGLFWVLKGGE